MTTKADKAAYDKQYSEKHREKIRKRHRKWRRKNKDWLKKYTIDRSVHRHEVDRKNRVKNKAQNMKWLCEYLRVDKISCQRCGYSENFGSIDAHHGDPSVKESNMDSLSRWLWRPLKTFVKKFIESKAIFLCANCHRSLRDGIWKIEEIKKGGN